MKLDKMKVGMTVEVKQNWEKIMTKIAKKNGAILYYSGNTKEHSIYEEDDIIQLNNLIGKPIIVDEIDLFERSYLSIRLKHDDSYPYGGIWINHKSLKRFK